MQWLKNVFLGYLKEWEDEVDAMAEEGYRASDRAKMTLSKETIDGLRMTGIIIKCRHMTLCTSAACGMHICTSCV